MEFAFATGDPDTVLIQLNAHNPVLIDLHRLDLATGEPTTLAEKPGRLVRWLPFPGGQPMPSS